MNKLFPSEGGRSQTLTAAAAAGGVEGEAWAHPPPLGSPHPHPSPHPSHPSSRCWAITLWESGWKQPEQVVGLGQGSEKGAVFGTPRASPDIRTRPPPCPDTLVPGIGGGVSDSPLVALLCSSLLSAHNSSSFCLDPHPGPLSSRSRSSRK